MISLSSYLYLKILDRDVKHSYSNKTPKLYFRCSSNFMKKASASSWTSSTYSIRWTWICCVCIFCRRGKKRDSRDYTVNFELLKLLLGSWNLHQSALARSGKMCTVSFKCTTLTHSHIWVQWCSCVSAFFKLLITSQLTGMFVSAVFHSPLGVPSSPFATVCSQRRVWGWFGCGCGPRAVEATCHVVLLHAAVATQWLSRCCRHLLCLSDWGDCIGAKIE